MILTQIEYANLLWVNYLTPNANYHILKYFDNGKAL